MNKKNPLTRYFCKKKRDKINKNINKQLKIDDKLMKSIDKMIYETTKNIGTY